MVCCLLSCRLISLRNLGPSSSTMVPLSFLHAHLSCCPLFWVQSKSCTLLRKQEAFWIPPAQIRPLSLKLAEALSPKVSSPFRRYDDSTPRGIILKGGSTPPPTPLGFWPPDRTGLCGQGSRDVPACILLSHCYTRGWHTRGGGQLLFLSDLHPSFFPWRYHLRSSFEWLEKDFWLKLANHVFHPSNHVICWNRTDSEYTISKPQHESPQDCWGYKREEVSQIGKKESKVSAICRRHDCISRKI